MRWAGVVEPLLLSEEIRNAEVVGEADLEADLARGPEPDLVFSVRQRLVGLDAGTQGLGIRIDEDAEGQVEAVSCRFARDFSIGQYREEGIASHAEYSSEADGVDDSFGSESQTDVGTDTPLTLPELAEAEEAEVWQEEIVGFETDTGLDVRVLGEPNDFGVTGQNGRVHDVVVAEVDVGEEGRGHSESRELFLGGAFLLRQLVGGLVLVGTGETLELLGFRSLDLHGRDDGQTRGGGDRDDRQSEYEDSQDAVAHGSSFAPYVEDEFLQPAYLTTYFLKLSKWLLIYLIKRIMER